MFLAAVTSDAQNSTSYITDSTSVPSSSSSNVVVSTSIRLTSETEAATMNTNASTPLPSSEQENSKASNFWMTHRWYIAAAVGGAVFMLLVVLLFVYARRKRSNALKLHSNGFNTSQDAAELQTVQLDDIQVAPAAPDKSEIRVESSTQLVDAYAPAHEHGYKHPPTSIADLTSLLHEYDTVTFLTPKSVKVNQPFWSTSHFLDLDTAAS